MHIKWTTFAPPKEVPKVLPVFASISRRGQLAFNYMAYRSMGQPEALQLLFDPVNALIGLKPVYPTTPHAHIIKQRPGRTYSFWISVKEFCNYYGISTERAIRFRHIEPTDDGTLILALDPGTKYFRRADV